MCLKNKAPSRIYSRDGFFVKYKDVSKTGTAMETKAKHLPSGVKAVEVALTKAQTLLLISAKPVYVLEAFNVSV